MASGDYCYALGGERERILNLQGAAKLWPTPDANLLNDHENPETWLARQRRHAAKENPTRAGMPIFHRREALADTSEQHRPLERRPAPEHRCGSADVADAERFAQPRIESALHRGGQSDGPRFENGSEAVAHAERGRYDGLPLPGCYESREGADRLAKRGKAMAHAGRAGLPLAEPASRPASRPASEFRRPHFPPGPGELARWDEILAHDPSLEPALHQMADGLAHRVDRLRLCGNGVVPDTAALAYQALDAELTP